MTMPFQTGAERYVVWNRLDVPGMDACRFRASEDGWVFCGTAIFIAEAVAAKLAYEVACFDDWSTKGASVVGWVGNRELSFMVERRGPAEWRINGEVAPGLAACEDIDLGFTPATNTNAIRKLRLRPGERGLTRALWLDPSDWTFRPLEQTYERKTDTIFGYASPRHDYHADLAVDPDGIVTDYPGLWAMISRSPSG